MQEVAIMTLGDAETNATCSSMKCSRAFFASDVSHDADSLKRERDRIAIQRESATPSTCVEDLA